MKRTLLTITALTTLLGTGGALTISEPVALATQARTSESVHANKLRDQLQADADALLPQGSPGVLVELDLPHRDIKVRSGYGNLDRKTPVPWHASFRIGSYTKTFVAATVLQLVGEGRLSLSDTVEDWLPGVVTGNGNDGSKISVRQLLQQTSGLPEYLYGMLDYLTQEGFEANRFRTYPVDELVGYAMAQPPNFEPGTNWSYSNTNYLLAGMIIEKVTGNSWRHEVEHRIIKPLGLRDTVSPGTNPTVPRPHATAYERFPDDIQNPDPTYGPRIDVTELNPSWGTSAGDMISTTEDGNKFLQALLSGKVLRPAELAEMKTTVRAKEFDPAWPGAEYGLGLIWIPSSCGGYWAHGGDIPGFKTRNGVVEDGSRSVMVSMNTDSLVPDEGVTPPEFDHTNDLIDNALCGSS